MNRASIVIGANYGDEGKGLVTDYLADRASSGRLVVRFNGGAQAGHTVVSPDGRRHVFSHFGSGTMAGASTYLSPFFVANPTIFLRESLEMLTQGVWATRVYIDPNCPVTTVYDMIVNQIVEQARGSARHGSVGLGFNETIKRSEDLKHRVLVRDLTDERPLLDVLNLIRKEWVPARLAALGFGHLWAENKDAILSRDLLDGWLNEVAFMLDHTITTGVQVMYKRHLIFEGAQGLLLDRNRMEDFPHLTNSNTGIRNALVLARTAGVRDLTVNYVTRSYLTRHGAGPMPNETESLSYATVRDETNVPHEFQGSLRYGMLDLDLLSQTIRRDLRDAGPYHDIKVTPRLVMTCMDQLTADPVYVAGGKIRRGYDETLPINAAGACGISTVLASYGPTRNDLTTEHFLPEGDEQV